MVNRFAYMILLHLQVIVDSNGNNDNNNNNKLRCKGNSMLKFLQIDLVVKSSNPSSAKLSLRVRRVASSL